MNLFRHHAWMNHARTALLAAGLLGLAACASVDPVTGKKVYNIYSIDEDVQLGQTFLQQNTKAMKEANVPVNADRYRVQQLREMMTRIAAVSDMPDLPYQVQLYGTNIVNAAAAPGGSMMVFEGLYNAEDRLVEPDDADELAAVMAHEIAHVNCRHVTERLSQVNTVSILATVGTVVAASQDAEDWAYAIQGAFLAYAGLYIPKYSRKNEAEADRVGLFYMAKAGYDPRAAARIWRRAAEEKGKSHGAASIFATHPGNKKRYVELEKLMPHAMEEYRKTTGAYPEGYTPPAGFVPDPDFDWRKP